MNTRMKENLMKVAFFIVCLLGMIFQSAITKAQLRETAVYKGLEVNFGVRSGNIESNIGELNQSQITQSGGRIGVVFGNENFRTRLAFGYYSSGANTAGTIDLLRPSASMNIYPLALLIKAPLRLEPYITGGLSYNNYKFYGYYLNTDGGKINYSNSDAPYLGSKSEVNSSIGLGLEFKLIDRYDFVHIFSEMTYGQTIADRSKSPQFENTTINKQFQVNIGVTFGARR